MRLEDVCAGQRLAGVIPGDAVTVLAAEWYGRDAVALTYRTTAGGLGQRNLFRADEALVDSARAAGRPFDAPAADFKLAAEVPSRKVTM